MELCFLLWQVVIVMAFNDNNNDVLIKRELLVLREVGVLYRKKSLDQYNSNNKLIHPWTVHQQIQPTSHTHTRAPHSKSNEVIDRKRWREYRFSQQR